MTYNFVTYCFCSTMCSLLKQVWYNPKTNEYFISDDNKPLYIPELYLQTSLLLAFNPPLYSNCIEKLTEPYKLSKDDILNKFAIINNTKWFII